MASSKRKLNLTIQSDLLERAKRVAELRGDSLSSLVEDFLARLAADYEHQTSDWLSSFHQKYLCGDYREPSDEDLKQLRSGIKQKYS